MPKLELADQIDRDILIKMNRTLDSASIPQYNRVYATDSIMPTAAPKPRDQVGEAMIDVGDINAVTEGLDRLFSNARLRKALFGHDHPPGQHPIEVSLMQVLGALHVRKMHLIDSIPKED